MTDQSAEPGARPPRPRAGRSLTAAVPVGRIMGVPLVIQPVWFLIVVVFTIGFAPNVRDQVNGLSDGASYAVALLFVLLLYASVLVHEISHVAVAKALGMQVRRIVLQLLGGASEIVEEQPGSASREFLVAAAGPLSSVMLAGVGAALAAGFPTHTVRWVIAAGFGYVNGFVAAFNLLPGLPLDGGRVLRSLVWQVTHDKERGTIAAGWAGRAVAIAIFFIALADPSLVGSGNVSLLWALFVAMFIWTNASVAIAQAKVNTALPRIDLRALTRRAIPVTADLPVAEAVRRAREGNARALVVVDGNGKPTGIVSEAAVTALPEQRQPWVSVSDLARPVEDGLVVRTDMDGRQLLHAVQVTPATEYLVVESTGAIMGVLSRADLIALLQSVGLK